MTGNAQRLTGGLTNKQQAFCIEFLKDFDAQSAARRAGYSTRSASQTAATLLAMDKIRAEINRRNEKQVEKAELSVEEVIAEIKAIAMFDITALFDDDGEMLPKSQWPPEAGRVLGAVDVQETHDPETGRTTRKIKVKPWSKTAALDQLMRYLGLYQDTLSVKVTMEHDEMAERIRRGREMVAQRRGELEATRQEDGSYDVG